MRELSVIRQDINAIDRELRELLLRRMAISREVAQYKERTVGRVFVAEREKEILAEITNGVPEPLDSYLKLLFSDIMRTSRQLQYAYLLEEGGRKSMFAGVTRQTELPERVCHQGVPGAYSQLAASAMFPKSKITAVLSFEDVFAGVDRGEFDCGVLPIDNSTAGSVGDTYDLLLKYGLYITNAANMEIRHCIAGLGNLNDVRTVYSHPQALAQCSEFIQKYNFSTVEATNTAVAAHLAADGNKSIAAIASVQAASKYGLNILQENIQNVSHNTTRFVAVQKKLYLAPNGKISIAFHTANQAGALVNVMEMFHGLELNITKIQSRPISDKQWEYSFYVDFDGDLENKRVQCVLHQLWQELSFVQLLGNFNEQIC